MPKPDKFAERVLVIPTAVLREAGLFQGMTTRTDHYLPRVLDAAHFQYRPRSEVETDPSFKQIIPYVVLRWRDQVFHYQRGQAGTETRLQALRSVGVGGHISAEDATLFAGPYREALFREVREEVQLDSAFEETCIGLINDDSSSVGQVHLGVVHVFDLAEPNVRSREAALARAGFAATKELKGKRDEFETWSQFVLDELT